MFDDKHESNTGKKNIIILNIIEEEIYSLYNKIYFVLEYI